MPYQLGLALPVTLFSWNFSQMDPLLLFDLQVLAQVTSFISPHPYTIKLQNEQAVIDKNVIFVVWTVCLPQLSAISVKYHGQCIEISSKSLLITVNLATTWWAEPHTLHKW